MYNKIHILLILSLAVYTVLTTEVEKCDNIPTPIVSIKDCEKPPCKLLKGTSAIMTVNFTSTAYVHDLKLHVSAKVSILPPITYPLDENVANVCKNLLNTHCPLEENEPGSYRLEMPIDNYPSISLKLTLTVQTTDTTPKKMACFTVACIVADSM